MTRTILGVLAALLLLAAVTLAAVLLLSPDMVGDRCQRPQVVLPESCPLDGSG